MPISPAMNNGFTPELWQFVKIVGPCHPRYLGQIVQVLRIEPPDNVVVFNRLPRGTITEGVCFGVDPNWLAPLDIEEHDL